MSARCGEPHPDDDEACIASEGRHVQHAGRSGRTWPNAEVVRQEERRVTPGTGLALAREVARRAERPTRAR